MTTTINGSSISQIEACIAGKSISFMYELNDIVQTPETMPVQFFYDFIEKYGLNMIEYFGTDDIVQTELDIETYLEDHKIEVVRLWLIERYK